MAGAHGLSGKGATAYREQNNVPFMMIHPSYKGGKRCKAVTSHVDIATTLVSLAGGDASSVKGLPGKDISTLLANPEAASVNALREGALYNFNMFCYLDQDFFGKIGEYFAKGGTQEKLPDQGFRPNMKKRGAIRSVFDGQYKFSRYYSPLEHHIPKTLDELFSNNDVELFDVIKDPLEMKNLALNRSKHENVIQMMNDKLNRLIEDEVGDDVGQMLPTLDDSDWKLSSNFKDIRL